MIQARRIFRRAALVVLGVIAFAEPGLSTARGQILYISDYSSGRVGTFDGQTGAAINATFITGLSGASGLAVVGGTLYVAQASSGRISTYDVNTGAVINANFITGLTEPREIAVYGSSLFVTQPNSGKVAQYNVSTGQLINASFVSTTYTEGVTVAGTTLYVARTTASPGTVGFYDASTGSGPSITISGLGQPEALLVVDGVLYVGGASSGLIGTYDAVTGSAINASFINTHSNPYGLSIGGGYIFETNFGAGTVGRYDVTTGVGTASFITGFTNPYSVLAIPEPSTWAGFAGLSVLGLAVVRRRRQAN